MKPLDIGDSVRYRVGKTWEPAVVMNTHEQGSRGRRILRPGTHKSGSGLLKIPKAESAGRMFFFPVGLLLIMVGLSD